MRRKRDTDAARAGQPRRRSRANPADIWVVATYCIIILGIVVVYGMYRTILSMNDLRLINSHLIQIWREVSQNIEFVTSNPDSHLSGPAMYTAMQSKLADLISLGLEKEAAFQSILEGSSRLRNLFQFGQGLPDTGLTDLSVNPELVRRAVEVRDAPFAIINAGFAYWPTEIAISIQSERYVEPLLQRTQLLASLADRLVRILYYEIAALMALFSLGLALIWLLYLRPAIRHLRRARTELQFVLDNAPALISSLSPDGFYRSANANYLDFVHLNRLSELRGRHVAEVLGADRWQKIRRNIEIARQDPDRKFEVELEIRGERRLMLASYQIQPAMHTSSDQVVALLVDITEIDQARQDLRLSKERLRITLDSIGDAFISTDVDGRVVEMNPQAARMTGWAPGEARGRPLREVLHVVNAETRARIVDPVAHVLSGNVAVGLADGTVLIARDGSERLIADSGAPIRDSSGATVGVVLIFRDVTEEYRLRGALRQSEKLKSVGLLAGGVAHDFNNLLAGIQGNVDLISVSPVAKDPEVGKRVDELERLVRRGAGLTDHLIQFAQTGPLKTAPVNVCELLDECLLLLRNVADKRITFELEDRAESCKVLGDASVLHAALVNILLNAVDAIDGPGTVRAEVSNLRGDEAGSIVLAEEKADLYVVILISDTGCGISEDNLRNVFDPFFTTKGVGKGYGLGLPAAYGTLRTHHGDISIESTLGQGTRVRLLLPAYQGDAMPAPRCSAVPVLDQPADRLTVLFADDEVALRDTAMGILGKADYRVILAENGQDCVDKFRDHNGSIDLVVADLNMPVKSGADAMAEIARMAPDTRFIVISGYGGADEARISAAIRPLAFLKKPFRFSDLIDAINRGTVDLCKKC